MLHRDHQVEGFMVNVWRTTGFFSRFCERWSQVAALSTNYATYRHLQSYFSDDILQGVGGGKEAKEE